MDETEKNPDQAKYDTLMVGARGVIYGNPKDPDSDQLPIFLGRLESGKKQMGPTIGQTAAMILSSIKEKIEGGGGQLSDDILLEAADELVSEFIDIAVAAKLMPEEKSEAVAKEALFAAMQMLGSGDVKSGKVTPERQAAAQQRLAALKPKTGVVDSKMEA